MISPTHSASDATETKDTSTEEKAELGKPLSSLVLTNAGPNAASPQMLEKGVEWGILL